MADESASRIGKWQDRWDSNNIGFHQSNVHGKLQKHSSLLFNEGQPKKFFVPLCGKTLDMQWLLLKGHDVVGLDGVKKALEEFCTEHSLQWIEENVPVLGPDYSVLKVKDNNLRLYKGDLFAFNETIEGQFDCVWDRGSLVALDRQDVEKYAELIKKLLKPGGKILVEVMEYDLEIFASEGKKSPPPPHPMTEAQVRSLYEPDCTVEMLEKDSRLLAEKEISIAYYLIVKKQ